MSSKKNKGAFYHFKWAVFLFLILYPVTNLIISTINAFLNVFLIIGQIFSSVIKIQQIPRTKVKKELFISIHIPTYNEPPPILMKTLNSIARVNYDRYEVLVIDNNTKDRAVWEPAKKYCLQLGNKFRFYHVDHLGGHKAGALNFILNKTSQQADFILILDADYQIKPQALHLAMSYYTNPSIGLIQFPQSYLNSGKKNEGISLEFKNFFLGFMNLANYCNCVLSTGTISFIKYQAFKNLQGFNTNCLTEDAEIGFRLNREGYKSIFVNRTIGKGLMPYDIEAMKKQRARWSFGNAQVLRNNFQEILLGTRLTIKQKIGLLTQLSAWFNFLLVPTISIVYFTALSKFTSLSLIEKAIIEISAWTIVSYLAAKAFSFIFVFHKYNYSLAQGLKACLAHFALIKIFAISWVDCLIENHYYFERTNKFILKKMPSFAKNLLLEIATGLILLTDSVHYFILGNYIVSFSVGLLGLALLSILLVLRQTSETKLLSHTIVTT